MLVRLSLNAQYVGICPYVDNLQITIQKLYLDTNLFSYACFSYVCLLVDTVNDVLVCFISSNNESLVGCKVHHGFCEPICAVTFKCLLSTTRGRPAAILHGASVNMW